MHKSNSFTFWLPALVCMVCQGLGIGLVSIYGFFTAPLAQEFNVSQTAINSGPIFLLLMPALLGAIVGRLADRLPIRNLLIFGVLVSMGSLFALSTADSFLYVTVCFVGFTIGTVFYGPISVNSLLIKLYRNKAGRALAIAAIGVSVATALLPACVGWLIEVYSWRQGLAILAIALVLILIVSIFLGLMSIDTQLSVHAEADQQVDKTTSTFFRDQVFWIIGLVVAIAFCSALVMAVCYPPHFLAMGFSENDAGLFISAAGVAGFVGKSLVALLIDRFESKLKYIAVLFLLLQIVGFSGLLISETFYLAMLSMVFIGLGTGAFIPIHPILNNGYFDASIIGRVNGAQVPMMLPLGLIGLPLSGYIFDQTGSYQLVITSIIVVFFFAVVLLLKLPHQGIARQA